MATAQCPHCSVTNDSGAQYCESCGMAMPFETSGPRIIDGASFASTAAGQQLQFEELHKMAKKAAGALLAVAIIQTVLGAIVFAVLSGSSRSLKPAQMAVLVATGAISIIFWGLYFWARKQPLPAAIVGLVLYVTLKVVNFVVIVSETSSNRNANFNGGIGNTGIGWLDIVIIVVLVQAISAGLKYRKMMQADTAAQV